MAAGRSTLTVCMTVLTLARLSRLPAAEIPPMAMEKTMMTGPMTPMTLTSLSSPMKTVTRASTPISALPAKEGRPQYSLSVAPAPASMMVKTPKLKRTENQSSAVPRPRPQ